MPLKVPKPDSEELRFLPWSGALGLQLERVDVVDGKHGGGHEPRQTHDGTDENQHSEHEQVQMIPTSFLQQEVHKINSGKVTQQLLSRKVPNTQLRSSGKGGFGNSIGTRDDSC